MRLLSIDEIFSAIIWVLFLLILWWLLKIWVLEFQNKKGSMRIGYAPLLPDSSFIKRKQLCFRLLPPFLESIQSWFVARVCRCYAFTRDEPAISMKGLLIFHDARFLQFRSIRRIRYKFQQIIWFGYRIWDLGIICSWSIDRLPMKTKQWFTVTKPSSVPGLGAYTSFTSADIINQLNGSWRLSKAPCNDIFWEDVWPRFLARGWHSKQPEERGYFTSKHNIVFIVPGVKRFSRGTLVKGDHYFDSISDILTKVVAEPELLEFEAGGELREACVNESVVAENSSDQSDKESSPSDSQRHRYLRSPCYSRGTLKAKFTVVDTSLATGGKLCDLWNLNAKSTISEPKTRLGDKDSYALEHSLDSQNVEMPQVMPLDAKNQVDDPMRFTIIDTSLKHREKLFGFRRSRHLPSDGSKKDYINDYSIKEETLERVNGPSKRLIKHQSTRQAETNYHSVSSAQFRCRSQFRVEGLVFLLYGDVRIIAESWSSQFLFLAVESIDWILNRRISIDLNWERINVIQQREQIFVKRRRFQVHKKLTELIFC